MNRSGKALAASLLAIALSVSTAQPAALARSLPRQSRVPATGGFVSYANLGTMPPRFIRQAEIGISRLPQHARARALAELPTTLRGQERKLISQAPASASGCNGNVCIDIEGSGLEVNWWNTEAGPYPLRWTPG